MKASEIRKLAHAQIAAEKQSALEASIRWTGRDGTYRVRETVTAENRFKIERLSDNGNWNMRAYADSLDVAIRLAEEDVVDQRKSRNQMAARNAKKGG